jgi:tRNA (Thr-GGU) A37 N-methylase
MNIEPIGTVKSPIGEGLVEGNILKVRGLDAVDATPVLDIKPYYPMFGSVKEDVMVKIPDWVNVLMEGYF